ncbi:MAG: MGMT family protein [Candidatus Shapirobacteria bacterium]|jgi:O-6-methylguanine DNA methyltransferase|nr:MGMT family protein [Candidatus Shapirobacteria bacterium]
MSFKQDVYDVVRKIPIGKVMTYKRVGEKLGSKAYQAIGQVLKNNPDPKNIPCHRVIKSNREIGGYFGHTGDIIAKKKENLLKIEGVRIVNGKVDINCVIL